MIYKHARIEAASIDGQFSVNAALWKLSPLFQIRNPEGTTYFCWLPSQALLPLLCSPGADWCACSLYKWLLIHYLKSVTLPDCPVGAQHCGGASCRCGQCGVSRPETTGTCPPGSTVRTQCAVRCTCTLHRWSFIHYLKSVTLPDCPVGAQHCGGVSCRCG